MQFSPLHSWSWDKLLTFSTSHGHEVYETVLDIQIRSDIHASRALRLKSNLFVKSLNFELHILSHNSGKYWPILYFLVSFCKFGSRESERAQHRPPQISGSVPNRSAKLGRKTANSQTSKRQNLTGPPWKIYLFYLNVFILTQSIRKYEPDRRRDDLDFID